MARSPLTKIKERAKKALVDLIGKKISLYSNGIFKDIYQSVFTLV